MPGPAIEMIMPPFVARSVRLALPTGGRRSVAPREPGQGMVAGVGPGGRRLFYFRGRQLIAATLRFTPSFAVIRRDVVLEGPFAAHGFHAQFDVSPDGREFVLLRDVRPESRLVFVHDWKEELRPLTVSVAGSIRNCRHRFNSDR